MAPPKWFSPPERCVLFFNELRVERSVRRLMRKGLYSVTFDRAFERVIKACAGRRRGRWHLTWITPQIMHAYADLFDAGYAHSVEVWNREGDLVGGVYGVAIGRAFFGESMFAREANASKIGQAVLGWHLAKWGLAFDDSKWSSPTLLNMGYRMIPRREFLGRLEDATCGPIPAGRWHAEAEAADVAAWRADAAPATPEFEPEAADLPVASARRDKAIAALLPVSDHATLGIAEKLLALV